MSSSSFAIPKSICLVSSEGQQFQVELHSALHIGIARSIIDSAAGNPESTEIITVKLPVKSGLLEKIVNYLDFHKDDPLWKAAIDKRKLHLLDNDRPTLIRNTPKDQDDNDNVDDSDDDLTVEESFIKLEKQLKGTVIADDQDDIFYQRFSQIIVPWDYKFMESIPIPELIELTKAANFLYIQPLLDLCCRTLADHMTGLGVEDIRKKFNIVNDFTQEEEDALKEEFSWATE